MTTEGGLLTSERGAMTLEGCILTSEGGSMTWRGGTLVSQGVTTSFKASLCIPVVHYTRQILSKRRPPPPSTAEGAVFFYRLGASAPEIPPFCIRPYRNTLSLLLECWLLSHV